MNLINSDTCTCSIRDVKVSKLFNEKTLSTEALKATGLSIINTSRFLKNSVYSPFTSPVALRAFSISAVPQTILRATVGSVGEQA